LLLLDSVVSIWVFIALWHAVSLRMHGAHSFSLLLSIPRHCSCMPLM
jgi:hypothetical protein